MVEEKEEAVQRAEYLCKNDVVGGARLRKSRHLRIFCLVHVVWWRARETPTRVSVRSTEAFGVLLS